MGLLLHLSPKLRMRCFKKERDGGDNGMFITLVPKVQNGMFQKEWVFYIIHFFLPETKDLGNFSLKLSVLFRGASYISRRDIELYHWSTLETLREASSKCIILSHNLRRATIYSNDGFLSVGRTIWPMNCQEIAFSTNMK